jgi:tetratricopeptide (TPR) repeat protein
VSENAAERTFRKGRAELQAGDVITALAHFEAAIRIEQGRGARPAGRYLSYFGVCLAQATGRVEEARNACERAVLAEFYNPDLLLNLGKVCLQAGDRRAAYAAFRAGLKLQGDHRGLRQAVQAMGIRRRPRVGFLRRSHPINRVLGRFSAP